MASATTSLAHRAHIAQTLSSLRRTTPRVPFWQLAAHRVPTLWTLYRGLLRNAPSEIVRDDIGWKFRRYRHLTSPAATKEKLRQAHRWLDIFVSAKQGDAHLQAVVDRYARMLAAKREKALFAAAVRRELAWQDKLRTRPRLTGTYLRSSLYNRPVPRMKPQPILLTGMIHRRRRARETRQAQMEGLLEMQRDLRLEAQFERELERREGRPFGEEVVGGVEEMDAHIRTRLTTIRQTFARDAQRAQAPYPPALVAQVRAARQFKVENKTRERLREERGEVVRATLRRARQGPPAHVLSGMSPEERRLDAVARSSVSEVGYVGQVKRRLGWKLRRPEAWKVEMGRPEDEGVLDEMERRIHEENVRRRGWGSGSKEGSGGKKESADGET